MNFDKEQVFENVLKYVQETTTPEELQDIQVSPDTLEMLVGEPLTEELILLNKDHYNKEFKHLYTIYGFDNFYDLYIYAIGNQSQEEVSKSTSGKSKNKDFSKLKKVKRTVMRNGKPTEMTFYEDPNKGKESNDLDAEGEEPEEDLTPKPIDARELQAIGVGDFEENTTTKDLKDLAKLIETMGGNKPFDSTKDSYMLLTDENRNVRGVVGFDIGDEFVTLSYMDNDELVTGIDVRMFYELVKKGLRVGKGIRTQHLGTRTFDILSDDIDMEVPEEQEGYYTLEKDALFEVFGYGE